MVDTKIQYELTERFAKATFGDVDVLDEELGKQPLFFITMHQVTISKLLSFNQPSLVFCFLKLLDECMLNRSRSVDERQMNYSRMGVELQSLLDKLLKLNIIQVRSVPDNREQITDNRKKIIDNSTHTSDHPSGGKKKKTVQGRETHRDSTPHLFAIPYLEGVKILPVSDAMQRKLLELHSKEELEMEALRCVEHHASRGKKKIALGLALSNWMANKRKWDAEARAEEEDPEFVEALTELHRVTELNNKKIEEYNKLHGLE